MKSKKVSILFLVATLVLTLVMPAAAASNQDLTLIINGIDMSADMHIQDNRIHISNKFLNRLPELNIQEPGYTPLRSFFEDNGGAVSWNAGTRSINVDWRNSSGGWKARDLMLHSNEILAKHNTYKMTGSMEMDMTIKTLDMEMPSVATVTFDAAMQHNPLNMYIRQAMDMSDLAAEAGLPEEASSEMVTEMVWTEDAIYQKTPFSDQWVRTDFAGMDNMNMLSEMIQANPQQSMEMMDAFGILYVFDGDKEIDGQEYYTLIAYVDTETFRRVFKEIMDTLGEAMVQDSDEDDTELQANIGEFFDAMLDTMIVEYYISSYINKKTLLAEHMDIDMFMNYTIDDPASPEGSVSLTMKMIGSSHFHSFGEAIELPDVSDYITMEELMEEMMSEMTEQQMEELRQLLEQELAEKMLEE